MKSLAFALLFSWTAFAADPLTQLTDEVRTLRRELLELRIEMQTAKRAGAEKELLRAQEERKRLENRESARVRDLARLDERLRDTSLAYQDRMELQSMRDSFAEIDPVKAANDRIAAVERESEAAGRLTNQEHRLVVLRREANSDR